METSERMGVVGVDRIIDQDLEPTTLHPSIYILTRVVNPPGSMDPNDPSEPTAM